MSHDVAALYAEQGYEVRGQRIAFNMREGAGALLSHAYVPFVFFFATNENTL